MTDLPGRQRRHAAVSLGLLHLHTCTVPNFFVQKRTHTHTRTRSRVFHSLHTCAHICLYNACMHGTRQKSPQNMGIRETGHYQTVWKHQLMELGSSAHVLSSGPPALLPCRKQCFGQGLTAACRVENLFLLPALTTISLVSASQGRAKPRAHSSACLLTS